MDCVAHQQKKLIAHSSTEWEVHHQGTLRFRVGEGLVLNSQTAVLSLCLLIVEEQKMYV